MLVVAIMTSLAACGEIAPPVVPTVPPLERTPTAILGIATPPAPAASPAAVLRTAPPTASLVSSAAPPVPSRPASTATAAATAIVAITPPATAPTRVPTPVPTPIVTPLPRAVPTVLPPTEMPSLAPSASPIITPRPTGTLLRPSTPTAVPTVNPANLMAAVAHARTTNQLDGSSVTLFVPGMDAISLDGMQNLYAASTIKLPIYLTLAYHIETGNGGFTWDTPVTVRQEDVVGGTGLLQGMVGQTLPMSAIAQFMVAESDNTAANLILGYLGGGHNAEWSDVRAGARAVTQDVNERLGVRGIMMQRGLEDEPGMALGLRNTVTTDALVTLLRLTIDERGQLAGADSLYALLEGRGMHNPWHPGEVVQCDLHLLRIGGIYPADRSQNGVRLDLLYVDGGDQSWSVGGAKVSGYFLAVGAVTTLALEPQIESRIAHFEGDVQRWVSGAWMQCVDNQTLP